MRLDNFVLPPTSLVHFHDYCPVHLVGLGYRLVSRSSFPATRDVLKPAKPEPMDDPSQQPLPPFSSVPLCRIRRGCVFSYHKRGSGAYVVPHFSLILYSSMKQILPSGWLTNLSTFFDKVFSYFSRQYFPESVRHCKQVTASTTKIVMTERWFPEGSHNVLT